MGYRSDITIIMQTKDYKAMFAKAFVECEEAFELLTNEDYLTLDIVNDEITSIHFDNIKWYSSFGNSKGYESVDFIESFLESGIPYAFERVGEEYPDYERKSNKLDLLLQKINQK